MGDTRGPSQDNINCDYILNYLSNLKQLHAICVLMKPLNTRSTVSFQYCLTEILSRLDKSASKNIVFVFTNTRATDYGPGDTFDILEEILDEVRKRNNVTIPFQKKNYFCVDNEAFKYLAALHKGIEFSDRAIEKYRESWNQSVKRFWSMIRYIQTLEPHPVQSICTINEARRMILQLSQPLANISELIHDKIEAIQKQDKKLQDENMTLGQLKKELFMPVIDLEVYTLDQPTTICTAINCSETYKVGDKDKFHYKQRCHEPCYLKNVRAETVNNQALFHCAAMNRDGVCKECNCSYTVHMHIYYTTKTVEKTIKNVNKMKNIDDTEKLLAEVEKLKAEMNMTKDELQREYDVIVNSCAKFTHFLQKNAITPFIDYYKDYIEYLITREETGGNNVSNVSHLRNLLNNYMESKKLFDGASKSESYQHAPTINSTDIQNTIRNLYGLKHTGRKIREMYECQQISRRREYEYTTQVYRPPPKPKQQNQQGLIERGINIVYNYVSRKPHKTNTVYAKGQGPSNYGDEEFRGAAYTHHAAYGKK